MRGLLPVALEDVRTLHEQLAVFGEAAGDVRQRLADGSHAIVSRGVDGEDWRGFREAIAFEYADADTGEPVSGVEAKGGAACDVVADPATEASTNFFVDEGVGRFPGQ